MLLKLITLLLIGCTLANTAAVVSRQNIQSNFNQVFMDSLDSVQNNPNRYKECYTYYGPLLTQVGNVYEKEVNICSDNAKESRTNITSDTYIIEAKSDVSKSAATLCGALQTCKENEDSLTGFECYSDNANKGSTITNGIKYKAIETVDYIQNLIRNIDSQENLCVNLASATYSKDWSILTNQLETCFSSNAPIDATTPSTTVKIDVTTEEATTAIV